MNGFVSVTGGTTNAFRISLFDQFLNFYHSVTRNDEDAIHMTNPDSLLFPNFPVLFLASSICCLFDSIEQG